MMHTGNDILNRVIGQATKGYKDYQIAPYILWVEEKELTINRPALLTEINPVKPQNYKEVNYHLDLGNDRLILTSNDIDLPITATITLESHNNLFTVTRAEYMMMSFNKHQIFENYLKISVKNYGEFIPFQLEFLKITTSI